MLQNRSACAVRGVVAAVALAGSAAVGQVVPIELTPTDVSSTSAVVFSALPTDNPAVFAFSGDVRGVDFDRYPDATPIPSGTTLTNQFAPLGVLMNSIRVSSSVYGGPASPPNATFYDQGHIFTFSVPVSAVGIINTSPDRDFIELWSGPDRTGTMLLRFRDQEAAATPNFNVDRFLGGRSMDPAVTIGSIWIGNASGNLELDELIFEIAPPVCPADWDGSGGIDGDDIGAFFVDWQAGTADIDGSGGVDGDDITIFFDHWQAGC